MKARVLIPRCRGRIAPLFDVAAEVTLFTVEEGIVTAAVDAKIDTLAGKYSPAEWYSWCTVNEITHLICSAISREYSDFLSERGMELIPGIRGNVNQVIKAWVGNHLTVQKFLMPGCRWRKDFVKGQCPRYREIRATERKISEVNPMKIAVPAQEKNLESKLDERFGRARGFIIFDIDSGEFIYKENFQNLNAPQGAGIQSAKNVVDAGAGVLLSGHVGPKAFATLDAAGVTIYTGLSGTVAEAIEKFRSSSLTPAAGADVDGHW